LAATSALAVTVEVVQPGVSVNRGNGYKPVVKQAKVSPGELVTAASNGSAKIIYEDGCAWR
jgi:hypothetical protein